MTNFRPLPGNLEHTENASNQCRVHFSIGYSVANRHKNGAWSSPNVLFGVSVKNTVHSVPTKETNYDDLANKVMKFYVTSVTDMAKKICTPEFPQKVYRYL